MGKVLVAPNYEEIDGPLIFLAGPIRGAADWHSKATQIINSLNSEINVASPKRQVSDDVLFTSDMKLEQIDWETFHLNKAAEDGVILFWLAKEKNHLCRRAYAQTTRFEISEWKERYRNGNAKIVIGIEDGFSGAKYIKHRLSQECPELVIFDGLESLCKEAVATATAKISI